MAYYGYKPAEQAIQIGDNTIVSADITDGSIVNADLNASAAIAMSKTQFVAGTGLTLATNTVNVDAAQTQITSVGTLGTLTVDNVIVNGTTIGHQDRHLLRGTARGDHGPGPERAEPNQADRRGAGRRTHPPRNPDRAGALRCRAL